MGGYVFRNYLTFPHYYTTKGGLHFVSMSALCFCNKTAEAQKTLKHKSLYGSQFWFLEGLKSMEPVSCSGYPTASQHGREVDRKVGMHMEKSHDKQGSKSPGRSQIHSFIATTLTNTN